MVLWVLLVALPVAFITLSIAVTPDDPAPVELVENGRRELQILSMSDLHGAVMVPITVGFLAGLAGLFVALGSSEGDRRLVLAGYRPLEVLAARLGVIVFAALLTTGASLAVTGASFTPSDWLTFAAANVLVAVTYGMIGVLVGPRLGLLGGLYLMLALPSSMSASPRTPCSTPPHPAGRRSCRPTAECGSCSTAPSPAASTRRQPSSSPWPGWPASPPLQPPSSTGSPRHGRRRRHDPTDEARSGCRDTRPGGRRSGDRRLVVVLLRTQAFTPRRAAG
jgi:hypothetical protein